MRVFIIITGSEFLYGLKQEKNSLYISQQCVKRGLDVKGIAIGGDDFYQLKFLLKVALDKADLVIVSGGLGATDDDITREAISEAIGVPLIYDEEWLKYLKKDYEINRSSVSFEKIKKMAQIPFGAKKIPNKNGKALGFIKVLDDVGKAILSLPGVPEELKSMLLEGFNLLGLKEKDKRLELIRTFGLKEIEVEENLSGIDKYSLITSPKGVDIVILDNIEENLNSKIKILKDRLGKYIYAIGQYEMEEVVGKLLRDNGLTISTAESSTGGLIASRIVNVSGSSEYFMGSVVAYSNQIKNKILGVKKETLDKHGAVSKQTAKEMVKGVKNLFETNIAISDTGIAGPTGATLTKPLGLHYIGLSTKDKTIVEKVIFKGERNAVRLFISQYALNLVRLNI